MKKQTAMLGTLLLVLNSAAFNPVYSLNSHLLGHTVYAEEPPADNEPPSAEEQNALLKLKNSLDDLEGAIADNDEELAEIYKEEAADFLAAARRAAKSESAKQQLAALEARYNALVGNSTPTPQPKVEVTTEPIPVTTTYVEDKNLDGGQTRTDVAGTPGVRTITITDGVSDGGKVTTAMVPKVVAVGTKPTVVTEEIPAPADVEERDPNLEEGKRILKTPAVKGTKKTTTTYSFNAATGTASANAPTIEETPGSAAVYRVGTKPINPNDPVVTTETEEIPVTTTYVEDQNLAYGETQTVAGKPGVMTYTVTDGVRDGGRVTTAMVPTVVTVGTKPTVVTEEVPAPADVEERDPSLEEGKRVLKTPAVAGKKVTTTTYSFDPATGKVTPNAPTVVETPGQAAVYLVGSKKAPVVTTETEEIPVTTTYVEDQNMAYGETQTVAGTAGVMTYTVTDGVRDSGSVTTAMVPTVVTVGTKPTVVEEEVPAPADVEEMDPTLEEGKRVLKTPAVAGKKVTTTTYSFDPATGTVTANSPTVEETPGQAAVYLVGTKKAPVVITETEEIPVTTTYVEDQNLAYGETQTVAGKPGVMTYTVTDGVRDGGRVTTAMVPTVVTVGTKPTVVTEELPAPADVEEKDPNLEEGKRVLKTPAVAGKKVTTTTYSFDPATGTVTANTPTVEETPGQAAVYLVGSKKADAPKDPKGPQDTPPSSKDAPGTSASSSSVKPSGGLPSTGGSGSGLLSLVGAGMMALAAWISFGRKKSND